LFCRLCGVLSTRVSSAADAVITAAWAHASSELEQGSLKIGVVPTGLGELEANFRSIANRVGAAIVVGALLLSSALLARVHRFEWLALAGFCLAALIGLYMLWKIIRTPCEL
jgi:hypothetical protein